MDMELRLRMKSSEFYENLRKFAAAQLVTHPQDSPKVGFGNRNSVHLDVPLVSQVDESKVGRIVATDLHLSHNTHLYVEISDAAEAWWKRLFLTMTQQGWTDWMPPSVVAPNATDDLMTHYLYAVSLTCANQGWEMKYLQPVSEDRTFCRIETALVSEDRRYRAMVRVTLNSRTPDQPIIEGAYHALSEDNNTTKAFADSLVAELTRSVTRWRERYPTQYVEDTVLAYLDADAFQNRYPSAYQKWSRAARLLSFSDWQAQTTTMGHLVREALQEFITVQVDIYKPPDIEPDKAKTVARLRAILNRKRQERGQRSSDFLDALLAYWGTVSDLVQRQEHGAQREGEPLEWEDARRIVFQTAVVMFEIDRALHSTVRED